MQLTRNDPLMTTTIMLLSSQVFEKPVDNLRPTVSGVIFATHEKKDKRYVSRPNFKEYHITNLTLINMANSYNSFDATIFMGTTVLVVPK